MRKSHRDCLESARSLWIHSLCSPSDRTCTRLHTEFKRTCLSSGSVHSILLAREYRNEWEAQKQPIAELFIRFVVWIFAIYCIQLQILSIQSELFCRGESGLRKRCFPKVINSEQRALSGQDVIMKSPNRQIRECDVLSFSLNEFWRRISLPDLDVYSFAGSRVSDESLKNVVIQGRAWKQCFGPEFCIWLNPKEIDRWFCRF